MISSKRIGPVVCPATPTVVKTPYRGPGKAGNWEVKVASGHDGKEMVYRSKRLLPNHQATIDEEHGKFGGGLAGEKSLASGEIYYLRARQSNSDWSRWHQGFRAK